MRTKNLIKKMFLTKKIYGYDYFYRKLMVDYAAVLVNPENFCDDLTSVCELLISQLWECSWIDVITDRLVEYVDFRLLTIY